MGEVSLRPAHGAFVIFNSPFTAPRCKSGVCTTMQQFNAHKIKIIVFECVYFKHLTQSTAVFCSEFTMTKQKFMLSMVGWWYSCIDLK